MVMRKAATARLPHVPKPVIDAVVDVIERELWETFDALKAAGTFSIRKWFISIDIAPFVEAVLVAKFGPRGGQA